MDISQTEAWLDVIEHPAPILAGKPTSNRLVVGGDVSISCGSLAGSARNRETKFFAYMHKRFGENIDPRSMDDDDLDEYMRSIRHHPSVGLSVVARMAQRKSGWSPTPGTPRNRPERFADYLDILCTAPCVRLVKSRRRSVSWHGEDDCARIRKPTQMLRTSIDGDFEALIETLRNLADSARSVERKGVTDMLFVHHELALDREEVAYNLYLTGAMVEWNGSGKAEIHDSELEIHAVKLEFDSADWERGMHRQIGRRMYCDEADWIQDVETPLGVKRADLRIVAA